VDVGNGLRGGAADQLGRLSHRVSSRVQRAGYRIPWRLSNSPKVRLISNLVDVDDPERLQIDQPLRLTIERERDVAVPRYRPETC